MKTYAYVYAGEVVRTVIARSELSARRLLGFNPYGLYRIEVI